MEDTIKMLLITIVFVFFGSCGVGVLNGKAIQDQEWHQCVSVCAERSVHDVKTGFCLCSGEWFRNTGTL